MCCVKTIFCFIGLTVLATAPLAETYVVQPDGAGDYPDIQAAIIGAGAGDVIQLTDGIFTGPGNRDVNFMGKAVSVISQSGLPENCIIDCETVGRAFAFLSNETATSVLEGITIRNGYSSEYGGGIFCEYSSPTITNCVFLDNYAAYAGGGICCLYYNESIVTDCLFTNNISNNSIGHGGGMASGFYCTTALVRCTFAGNQADTRGGGFHCGQGSHTTLSECTFFDNTCIDGSNLGIRHTSSVVASNCIFAGGKLGSGVYCDVGCEATLYCSDIFGNEGGDWVGCVSSQYGVDGNISADPFFCDADAYDLTLQEESPCAPFTEPNPSCSLIGAWPIGCPQMSPTREITWGTLKRNYLN
jgi:Chlamydia polymorphic membrane protein (Chlamydia_PMP) repeat